MTFTHLQTISTNSLMKSTLTIKDLVEHASQQGHQAIALTDHNILYEAIEFYERAHEHQIQPIIGLTLDVEGYITTNETYPLILLAKNYAGYQELIQLSSMHELSDNDSVPLSEVILRSEDLFVFAPGIEGEIISLLEMQRVDEATEIAQYFNENFSSFYLGVSLQHENQAIFSFYHTIDIPLVALGNVQYLTPDDALPTKVLRVLESDMPLGEDNQATINQFLGSDDGDYSLTPPAETYTQFKEAGFGEAADATQAIAQEIHLEIPLDEQVMPSFPVPDGETSDSYLRKLCFDNLEKRVENVTDAYHQRIEKELTVISDMGFSDYFLIVWDIMIYAHQQNIYTGSGRGSAAGSLVAHLLEITNADPIAYDLLFERFLNKERYTMPDIDLDFPDNRREEILEYIYNKYGTDYVAQIGTIGTYGAKSAVRDVARVLGLSQDEMRRWSKAIPSGPDVNLENSMTRKTFENLVNESHLNRRIYDIARKIEGRNRHVSTHAAAVVIADQPLTNRVPLQQGSGDIRLTQFTMDAVENVGLLKLDILGLRNLSILSDCIRFIPYENGGQKIDIDAIPFNDQNTLEVFRQGRTDGVFQFESSGIRRVLQKLQPNSFEDVVAVNALYRPGPMEQIDTFIKRKNGEEPIRYPHDDLKDILEITYGVMVYQEQVMQVASKLAGYSLNDADILRRNISAKDHEAIEEGRQNFVEGAIEKGYEKETALEVYGYIEKFADYGFNRSHAVAYSKVAYQLAYVKANYPASFYAAVMNASGKEKRKTFVTEAKHAGVKFLGPDVNKSFHSLMIDQGDIRFGFDIIDGVPRNFIQEIVQERKENGKYQHLIHFLSRMDARWLDEEKLLPLLHSGAFDNLKHNRSSLLKSLTSVVESIGMSHGNTQLFDIFAPKITEEPELSDEEKMTQEFEVTGYYFTAEPGEKYNELRDNSSVAYIADASKSKKITLLVVVEEITQIQTKNGHPMSFADVMDSSGKASLTLFPKVHRRVIQHFDEGDTVLVEGEVEKNKYPVKIIVNKLTNADALLEKQENASESKTLYIRFQSLKNEQKKLEALQKVLNQYHGTIPVIIFDQETNEQKAFKEEFYASEQPKLLEILEKMFGNDNFVLKKAEKSRN